MAMGTGRVLVIGAGVSGLTSALCLRRRGLDVTVVAEAFAPRVVSVVAGALWEWPPAVCGHHKDAASLERSRESCLASYRQFEDLAGDNDTGVSMRQATFYFRRPIEECPLQSRKMRELAPHVKGFVHDAGLIGRNGVNPAVGMRDAYSHLAPVVDTDTYMRWLLREVVRSGCLVIERRITGPLAPQEITLLGQFHADVLVNCAGLGAAELASDQVYPLRGALVRARNDGRAIPRFTEAHCVPFDEASGTDGFIFILPRGRDTLLLGGLAEADEWSLDIGLDNHAPVREMLARCVEFMPVLKDAEIDTVEPVRVGLRPARRDNVRLGHEPGTRIVHNYGHGGSGVTFSWGCAMEVALAVDRMVAGVLAAHHSQAWQHISGDHSAASAPT